MASAILVVGSVVGLVTLSVLTVAFHWIFFRSTLGDGQYALVFIVNAPAGAILGALTGFAFALWSQSQIAAAGWMAAASGGILILGFFLIGWFLLSGTESPSVWERLLSVIFWFGVPLLWSGALSEMGRRLITPR